MHRPSNTSGELLDKLIKAEVAEREVRSINYQMKIARFPAHTAIWPASSSKKVCVNVAQVKTLHRCEFVDETENIVLHRRARAPARPTSRPPSVCRRSCIIIAGFDFLSTIELVNALEYEKLNAKQGRIANRLTHADLVILDELGYLAVQPGRRCIALSSDQQAVRENQSDHHH